MREEKKHAEVGKRVRNTRKDQSKAGVINFILTGLHAACMHCVKTWSSTQMPLALSSAEAEYYAMVDGATRGPGAKTMLSEMGLDTSVLVLSTDSSAAKSFPSQRGLKKMRR